MLATFQQLGLEALIGIGGDDTLSVANRLHAERGVPTIGCPKTIDGWIACYSGVAAAADYILVPEVPVDFDKMCALLKRRRAAGKPYGIVVVSEGAKLPQSDDFITKDAEIDEFGHVTLGGIGEVVADIIEKRTGIETRWVTLGHLQRGGSPSAYDRVLGTRLGTHAARLAIRKDYGKMVALRGTRIVAVQLADAVGEMRQLDKEFLDEASEFFK
jgi:6-phosphofructokinase 1